MSVDQTGEENVDQESRGSEKHVEEGCYGVPVNGGRERGREGERGEREREREREREPLDSTSK